MVQDRKKTGLSQMLGSSRRRGRRWRYGMLSLFAALALVAGAPMVSQGFSLMDLLINGAQVFQLYNISDAQEIELGNQIDQELATSGQVKYYDNPLLLAYVNRIGQRLAQQSTRPSIPYVFRIVEDPGINAFATMGGHVYVNTGLIAQASNEAELASVIAHEIGHIAGKHAIKQMREQAIAQGILSSAGLDQSMAVQLGMDLALHLPKSRKDELEADRLGLDTLRQANYAPSAMVSFMNKLLKGGGGMPTILSTHPATQDRINALQARIDPRTANRGDGLNTQGYQRLTLPYLPR